MDTRRRCSRLHRVLVLAQFRRGADRLGAFAVDSIRRKWVFESSVGRVGPYSPRLEVGMVENSFPVVDGRDRNPEERCQLDDFFCGVVGGPGPHDFVPLVGSLVTGAGQGPGSVLVEQVAPSDHAQEGFELLACVRVEADPAVGCRLDGGDLDAAAGNAEGRAPRQLVGQVGIHAAAQIAGFHEGAVEYVALAGGAGLSDGGEARRRLRRCREAIQRSGHRPGTAAARAALVSSSSRFRLAR